MKNTSISNTSFKLNYNILFHAFYKKDVDFHFKPKTNDKLIAKLRELTKFC